MLYLEGGRRHLGILTGIAKGRECLLEIESFFILIFFFAFWLLQSGVHVTRKTTVYEVLTSLDVLVTTGVPAPDAVM